ncbi:hypothetical protein [Glutamicibacter soli]
MITTLDQLGYSTQKMLKLAEDLRKRSTTGGGLVGYRPTFIDSQIRTAAKPIQSGKPAPRITKDMGMSGAPFAAESKSIRPKRLLHSPCLAN